MTIKSKLLKFIEYPEASLGYFIGVSPNHLITFLRIKGLIKNGLKTYIDVGANKGDLIRTAKYFYPHIKIYAFDPIPNVFKFKDNINTKFFNIGLSDKKEKKTFYYNEGWDACSTLHKPLKDHHSDFEPIEHFKKIKVHLDRFDNLNLEIKKPCFLKIDSEGHEFEVLKGFGDKLKEIDIIQLEHCFRDYFSEQKNIGDTFNLLKKFGFGGIIQINSRYAASGALTHCDFIFFRIK